MATESIGKTIYLDDESADRLIVAIEREDAQPSKPKKRTTPWGDTKDIAMALERKFLHAK
jgi:hypothetical protein